MRKVVSYLTIGCNDLDRAVAFYDPVLGAFGIGSGMDPERLGRLRP